MAAVHPKNDSDIWLTVESGTLISQLLSQLSLLYTEVRQNKLLCVRAVLVGSAAMLLAWTLFAQQLADLDDWLFVTGLADIRAFWRGGRASFSHFVIGAGLNFMVGWIVGRTHRGHHGAMLWSFFVALIVLVDLPRVLPAAIEAVQTSNGAFTRFFGIGLADFIFLRLPILAGGIWCVRQKISQQ
jgi:hypothetical protein